MSGRQDLGAVRFFFWGLWKQKVYKSMLQTVNELCAKIIHACAEITPNQNKKVITNVYKRTEKCMQVNGGLMKVTRI